MLCMCVEKMVVEMERISGYVTDSLLVYVSCIITSMSPY